MPTVSPETKYDLERFTESAIVKGPCLLPPMSGDAFLAMLEAVKAPPAAAASESEIVAKLKEQLLEGQAANDKAAQEWADKFAKLEAELAAAKSAAPNVDAIEAPLKAQIASLEDIYAGYKISAERDRATIESLQQETTEQGNIARALEEKAAAAEAKLAETEAAAKVAAEESAAKIATLEAKVKALAAV